MNQHDRYAETESMSITEARESLTRLPELLARENKAIALTRRGRPVLAVLPWELYESVINTLEIMEDQETLAALREGIQQMERGGLISWDDAVKRLEQL